MSGDSVGRLKSGAKPASPLAVGARIEPRVERDLVKRAQAGDQGAHERLVVALNPFIEWIAARYETPSAPLDDLVQEGRLGLLQAIAKFDPSRGTRLTTFAKPWIEGEVRRAVRESSLIRLPAEKALALTRLKRAQEGRDRELSVAELAGALEISTEEVLELSSITRPLLTGEELSGRSAGSDLLETAGEETYSRAEVESLLATYGEHRGRVEGTMPPERPITPSKRAGGGSSPLHARLLDLEDALNRLPDRLFQAVELQALYGLSAADAAQWLDVHPNTARNRYAAAVRAIVDHLNGVDVLPPGRRRGSWSDELNPVESLGLVVRKYESFLEEIAAWAASGDPFWQGMEVGWVLHEDDGWVPLLSRDVRQTARLMRRGVRPLSQALGSEAEPSG
jgi:RNA polymerase sigma factor (sigma-70 family)